MESGPDGEVFDEVVGGFTDPGPDDEREPGIFERVQIRGGEHPRIGNHDDVFDTVAVLEGPQHREEGGRFAGVAGERVDLQREPAGGDQQPDDDLRVHAAFFAHPDLAEIVLVFGFEIQGRDVVEHQGQFPRLRGVSVSGAGDLVTPVLLNTTGQGPPDRPQRCRRNAELTEDTDRVCFRRRLHRPSEHEFPERVVAHDVEPEPNIRTLEHLPKHTRGTACHDRRRRHRRRRAQRVQIERELPGLNPVLRDLHQHGELSVVMRGADVFHDRADAAVLPHDLHRRRARGSWHLPHEQAHPSSLKAVH